MGEVNKMADFQKILACLEEIYGSDLSEWHCSQLISILNRFEESKSVEPQEKLT